MSKKPDWPPELNEPFSPHRIAERAVKGLISTEGAAERIDEAFISEIKRRVTVIAAYLGLSRPPQSEREWLSLIYYLCRYWQIPAFQDVSKKRRGAKTKWTDQKRLELVSDVASLVDKSGMKESAARSYIARNPRKFNQKYPTNPKTVRREFLRAKKENFIPF
jgi:hypothetical protein